MAHSLLATLLVVLLALVGAAVASAEGVVMVRRRRAARRAQEARAAARLREDREGIADAFDLTNGVVALASSIPGVRLAAQVARAGLDVSRVGLAPAVAGSLRRIADYAESDRPVLQRVVADDGSLVLMFSDIEGSTALNERLGDAAWLELLGRHDGVVRAEVRRHHGQVVKTHGDSFMVVFRGVTDALRCAVAIQRGLAGEAMRDQDRIRVRVGIHRGEVTRQGRDVFGLNVALAARVASEADGGEILVSEDVVAQASSVDGIVFGSGRAVRLKGFSQPVTVHPVHSARRE
ncbi:MAG TPA: adenylate/guanylate cyclase domain-containing protein [Candidatus Dormibacteraeota bacterium]|nr:adenylate/guanylate cyclase domain-containing protein [Candidatus Dormibacteraeota bacterium]